MADNRTGKTLFTKSNLGNAIFFAAILAILFVPAVKSSLLRGLMAVGFFQPKIEEQVRAVAVPDITLKDAAGKELSLASLKGKVVFLNFWATWCGPCLTELPSINALHTRLNTNPAIIFITVDVDNNLAMSTPFMKKRGFLLPVYGTDEAFPADILSGTIPTTIVIDKSGQMIFHHAGIADYSGQKFEKYLLNLAAE
ncbi:TlpA family protein disulfide reductase [Mucilaginibacter sp.]|uniref:TlpA family protein disulfide reductase n=1 Tax=Mucilaginibacter sp. TaxID=1882438 RepID=UPI0035BBB33D